MWHCGTMRLSIPTWLIFRHCIIMAVIWKLSWSPRYMACFMADPSERDLKLGELYLAAYHFVNQRSSWCAISALADYIWDEPEGIISCEDVISLLKSRLAV